MEFRTLDYVDTYTCYADMGIGIILKKKNAVVGLADGTLYSDGKAIYEAENLKVGLFK